MSYIQLIVQALSALAWPATVLVIVLVFRAELRRLAARLSKVNYGEFSLILDPALREVEREVKQLASGGPRPRRAETEQNALTSSERLKRIAEISPRAAIMEAWHDIEILTKKVADAHGVAPSSGQIAGAKAIQGLVQKGLLPQNVTSVYEQMRRLRAKAAHAVEFSINPNEAERYIDTSREFQNALLALLPEEKAASTSA